MFTSENNSEKYVYEKPLNFNMREFSLIIGVPNDDIDKLLLVINYLEAHENKYSLNLEFKTISGDTTLTINSDYITFNLSDCDSLTSLDDSKIENVVDVMFSVKRSKNIDLNLAQALSSITSV